MQKVFPFIKKKRNLRRLSAIWLCLVLIELFCPVFCDEPTFAATNSPQTTVNYSISSDEENISCASISGSDHQNSSEEKTVCNDECLCHATAVPVLNVISLKESIAHEERIAFGYGEPVFNSLPPPYLPPKNS